MRILARNVPSLPRFPYQRFPYSTGKRDTILLSEVSVPKKMTALVPIRMKTNDNRSKVSAKNYYSYARFLLPPNDFKPSARKYLRDKGERSGSISLIQRCEIFRGDFGKSASSLFEKQLS